MAQALATSPNQVFSGLGANPWGALRLAATIPPVDRSTHATHVRRRLRRCGPLPPRDDSLPSHVLADPFASPRRFLWRPRASDALRKSFVLRASRNRRAGRAASP